MNLEDQSISVAIEQVFCASFRAFGFVLFWPLESSIFSLKLILALGFAISGFSSSSSVVSTDLLLIGSELLFGILIGLPIAFVLAMIEWWAELFETGRGQTLGSILDPLSQQENNTLSTLCRSLFWILILSSPLLLQSIGFLLTSYTSLPVGNLSSFWREEIFAQLLSVLYQAMSITFIAAIPFAVLFLLIETIIALAGKLLPNVSLTQEAFITKTFLGFIGLLALSQVEILHHINDGMLSLSFIEQAYGRR